MRARSASTPVEPSSPLARRSFVAKRRETTSERRYTIIGRRTIPEKRYTIIGRRSTTQPPEENQ